MTRLEPKATLECRDLDNLTTCEEVKESGRGEIKDYAGEVERLSVVTNSREQKMAFVRIS